MEFANLETGSGVNIHGENRKAKITTLQNADIFCTALYFADFFYVLSFKYSNDGQH